MNNDLVCVWLKSRHRLSVVDRDHATLITGLEDGDFDAFPRDSLDFHKCERIAIPVPSRFNVKVVDFTLIGESPLKKNLGAIIVGPRLKRDN